MAQASYVVRFKLEKKVYVLGEPIFTDFTIQNTGAKSFVFRYRIPSRASNSDLQSEPKFRVTDSTGHGLPDPAPHPCGGAKGRVVYGSVTLPPGQAHVERWLLNEWARFVRPGSFHVSAKRRLPLMMADGAGEALASPPAAYALAIDDLSFQIKPSSKSLLPAIFEPYLAAIGGNSPTASAEGMRALTTLPHDFFFDQLASSAVEPSKNESWSREEVLKGLARLDTPRAWNVIQKIASGEDASPKQLNPDSGSQLLRSFAILLLGEKRDARFIPSLARLAETAPEPFRGDALRSLGFFNNPRATRVLFNQLHSPRPTDRVNATLALKNLGTRDVIPALLAMLNDPDVEVRQVADFSLRTMTGQAIELSANSSPDATRRAAGRWHAWWRAHGASFVPRLQPACHDW